MGRARLLGLRVRSWMCLFGADMELEHWSASDVRKPGRRPAAGGETAVVGFVARLADTWHGKALRGRGGFFGCGRKASSSHEIGNAVWICCSGERFVANRLNGLQSG